MFSVSPFAVIRSREGEDRDVLIADPWTNRFFAARSHSLVDALSRSKLAEKGSDPAQLSILALDEEVVAAAKRWHDRGWGVSLDYYLWSRQVRYADAGEDGLEVRRNKIVQLLNRRTLPEREKRSGPSWKLPFPVEQSAAEVRQALLRRRTERKFRREQATLQTLSDILEAGCKRIRSTRKSAASRGEDGILLSFGAGLDFFIIAYDVAGLANGVYFYDVAEHCLVQLQIKALREEMTNILQSQNAPATANWTIVMTVDCDQYQWRYRHERALRNIYIELGRVAQRLIIAAVTRSMGTLPTPAVRDGMLSEILELDSARQFPAYTLTMGYSDDAER